MSDSNQKLEIIRMRWQQAQKLQDNGKLESAFEHYHSILEIDGEYLPALHQMAKICEAREQFFRAVDLYQQAIEIDNIPPFWLYRHLGYSLSQTGDLEGAIEAYHKALSLQPEDIDTYNLLGQVQEKFGDTTGAISSYQKLLQLEPKQPSWVYLHLADMLKQQGDVNGAVDAYQKVLELEPENTRIRQLLEVVIAKKEANQHDPIQRARQLQQAGKLDEALAEYRAVLALDDRNLVALHQVGLICEQQGKWEEAVEGYRKAIQVDTEPPFWVYRHLGFALSQQGMFDDAVDAYQKAIELNPKDAAVWSLLEGVQQEREHLLKQLPKPTSRVSWGIRLSDITASGRAVMGHITASSSVYPPFGLSAGISGCENTVDSHLDISFKKQDITSGYCVKIYSFKVIIPLKYFEKDKDNIIVNIFDSYNNILSQSKINTLIFQKPFGIIEGISELKIWGWAWDPAYPNSPVQVSINARGDERKSVIANRYRHDLHQAGFGDGCHGFEYIFESLDDMASSGNISIQGGTKLQISNHCKINRSKSEIKLPNFLFRLSNRVTIR